VTLDIQDDTGCRKYVELNPEVLEQDPRTFLTEATNAVKARKEAYAVSCLWRELLITECQNCSARERIKFFLRLEKDNEMHEKLRLVLKEAWLTLRKRILGPHAPLPTSEPVYIQIPTRLEPPRQQSLPNRPMPVNQPNGGDRHQSSVRTTNTCTLELDAQFADSLADKRAKVIEEAKENPRRASNSVSRSSPHPSIRPSPKFGTQWIDINAPKARENWPNKNWPYIPTLAFLDSGSCGNINSISKDFLEKKLKMSYSPTNDRIRGHKTSFAPIGVVDLEFHPFDTNDRGVLQIDVATTRSFYVHDENDLFGQILLGREYMESRQDKIGLPTHKVTKKMTPGKFSMQVFHLLLISALEEQKVANETTAKRDAASQRVWEANNSGNSPPGNNVGNPSAQQGTNRRGQST
jgi:hypothetical protein